MAFSLCTTMFSLLLGYPEFILAIAFFIFARFRYRCARNRLPVNWPVVGMIPYLSVHAGDLHDWCTDVLRRSGCTFVFKGPWGFDGDLLLTCDPANANHVFNANFSNYPKGGDFAAIFDVLGNGIFNADGESWRFQRRKAHSLIADRGFRSFVVDASRRKVEKGLVPLLNHFAGKHAVFDLQDVFMRLTFDITCVLVFGVDPSCLAVGLPAVPFAKALDDAEEALFFRHVTPPTWNWIRFFKEKKLASAAKTLDEFIYQYINTRKQEIAKGSYDSKFDLLSSYLESEEETTKLGFEFDKFLRDTALNLMVAGRDTTSSGLTWFFWLLAKNPDVEAKVLEELKEKQNGDLSSLVYLHAALLESLRLYPPVPFEHKSARRPETLPSGDEVYRRRMVLFSLYAMGRMEGIWGKDCMEFRPERWISESGKVRHEPAYKFMVFNCGPRTCLGKDIAFMQMKAAAAAIVGGFRVELVEGFVARPKLSIILHMKDGLMVRVTKREEDGARG